MANDAYSFDKKTANRMVEVVKWVEKEPRFTERADYGSRTRPDLGSAAGGGGVAAFHVWLTQNGGSAGTDGTAGTAAFCSYTYDVYADSGKTQKIGTALAVRAQRFLKVALFAATEGLAQWENGTLMLLMAWESADRDNCS